MVFPCAHVLHTVGSVPSNVYTQYTVLKNEQAIDSGPSTSTLQSVELMYKESVAKPGLSPGTPELRIPLHFRTYQTHIVK